MGFLDDVFNKLEDVFSKLKDMINAKIIKKERNISMANSNF